MNNYKDEVIPDYNELLDNINFEITDHAIYRFSDIYILKNNEVVKNIDFINSNFKYNSFLNKNDKKCNEIKGLYIFIDENEKPIYTGISKTIFRRLKQHIVGKNHNESTLVYIISLKLFKDKYKKEYEGERKDFPLDEFRYEIQSIIKEKWKFIIIPETDNYKLYFKELYISCKFKTFWNTFETH